MGKETKRRDQIDQNYKWNIEEMYPDEAQWKADYKTVEEKAKDFAAYSGRLGESPKLLLEALQKKDTIWLILEKVYTYARMKKDEDNRVNQYQAMSDKASTLIAKTSSYLSFFIPELLEIPEEKLLGLSGGGGRTQALQACHSRYPERKSSCAFESGREFAGSDERNHRCHQ